jgi:crotonobetainyl-CoA:carnitine CoA-transferase CaiB-like acyl-CoA transferase
MSGLMSLTGEPDGEPLRAGVAITDLFTGVYSTTAILAALHQRAATGRGQHIDMALLDCAVSITANQSMNYLSTGTPPVRTGNWHPNVAPYQVFEVADGHMIIATGNDAQYQRLCDILGLEDMKEDPDYRFNPQRIANRPEMIRRISEQCLRFSKADLLAECEAQGVPAGPINDMAEVFKDPQVIAREMRIDPEGVPGVRAPFRFSEAELKLDQASPKLATPKK